MMQEFSKPLLAWYETHARELPWRVSPAARKLGETPDPYHVWLSEIMLQQTVVATVKDYFLRFTTLWPRVEDLAQADSELVMREWAGLGYYARARNLHKTAKLVAERGGFPEDLEGLQQLPGIGPYTAAAIAAIAYDKKSVVIDGNVNRIMVRHAHILEPIKNAGKDIAAAAQARLPQSDFGNYAQALMDLGATICRPKSPLCDQCPVQNSCQAFAKSIQADLPAKPLKKPRPVRHGHLFLMKTASEEFAYIKRPEHGLLGGLWAFPTSDWQDETPQINYPATANWQNLGQIHHVFTHFELFLTVHFANVGEKRSEYQYFNQNELPRAALPTLFRKARDRFETMRIR